jgi:NTE family protein
MATQRRQALVLQGGGALGAYEAGVIRGLCARDGFTPDVVTGVSIGAVNAAVFAGAHGEPARALRDLWDRLAVIDLPWLPRAAQKALASLGNAAMYYPRPGLWLGPLAVDSLYDTGPLRSTLERLVDFTRLNEGPTAVALAAVDVESCEPKTFTNRGGQVLSPEHILASGSLPPGFPMTVIEGRAYWDGGLSSNTPIGPAIDLLRGLADGPDVRWEITVVELFPRNGTRPTDLPEVADRFVEMLFTSRLRLDARLAEKFNRVAALCRQLDRELPSESAVRNTEEFRFLSKYRTIDKLQVFTRPDNEPTYGPSDFSHDSIRQRLRAGYREVTGRDDPDFA